MANKLVIFSHRVTRCGKVCTPHHSLPCPGAVRCDECTCGEERDILKPFRKQSVNAPSLKYFYN